MQADVPATWPPEYLDTAALEFTRDRLREGARQTGWWMYFIVLAQQRLLIGSGGYKGPPATDGTVEIGYGIVADQRLRGYASEAAQALIAHAFASPKVTRVIGETLPELKGSIAVMRRCGLHPTDGASEPGVIRFALTRLEYARLSAAQDSA